MNSKRKNRIAKRNPARLFLIVFSHKKTICPGIRLTITVIRDFFFSQFHAKYVPGLRPVKSVDHPLDNKIPFLPEYVNIYLTFIELWLKSLLFLYNEFGNKALDDIKEFLIELEHLYREAGSIYKTIHSTTNRPDYTETLRFKIIHIMDPHLNCVPSLHVMVVCFNYLTIGKIIDKYERQSDQYLPEREYLFNQAVKITDSVLLIKQHSINCIPSAFYALSEFIPEFDDYQMKRVANDLFTLSNTHIEEREQILDHIFSLYAEFKRERGERSGEDFKIILIDFLRKYSYETYRITSRD